MYQELHVHMNNLSRDAERQGNNNNTTERQSNTTQLARNSHFSKKNWLHVHVHKCLAPVCAQYMYMYNVVVALNVTVLTNTGN